MRAKEIIGGGILVAITMILIYFASLPSVNMLTLYCLSGFMPIIAYIRYSLKTAIMVYITSIILGLFLFGGFSIFLMIPYIFIVGPIGIVKAFIERFDNLIVETILKIVHALILSNVFLNTTSFSILLVGCIIYFIFDYGLTLLIVEYYKYFK